MHAVDVGASYLGVILASGPRLLSEDQARVVLGPRRSEVRRVGVFGRQSTAEVIAIAARLDLDVVQLHGDVTVPQLKEVALHTSAAVWPVLRVEGTTLPEHARALAVESGVLVLDAKVGGQLGGTGTMLDWFGLGSAVRALRRDVPGLTLVLAGGLRASNVAIAIRHLEPDVVDVSSGVECAPGVKDPAAVEQFVLAVHAATEMDE